MAGAVAESITNDAKTDLMNMVPRIFDGILLALHAALQFDQAQVGPNTAPPDCRIQ